MAFMHVFILALVQGLTEFLPISSSAHLILAPLLNGWRDQGIAFDISVHVGTLSAVIIYFRHELVAMTRDWYGSLRYRRHTPDSRLAWAVLLGTIPVGLAGLAFKHYIETDLRSAIVIATTSIGFGVLLGLSDWLGKRRRDEHSLNWKDVLFIGIAQAVALIPGTSRSGITMTAGLMLGLTRQAAARFSFLLSIPVIVLSGGLAGFDLLKQPVATDWTAILTGMFISFISALLCIHFFLKLLDRIGMLPFVIYRILLGIALFWIFL
jgi:undecaprenyl-diphosphatase